MKRIELANPVLVTIVLAVALLADSRVANALAFSPTEQEWNAWTDLCRARYVASGAGVNSKFSNRVSRAEVSRHEADVGRNAWFWLHHYCAGLIYLDRAQKEASEAEAGKWLREADVNIQGQYRRMSRAHYMFPDVAVTLARVYREMGDTLEAMKYLAEAMQHQPGASSPYALAALIYREDGNLGAAREVLLIGSAATEGTSAELHFLLGHIYTLNSKTWIRQLRTRSGPTIWAIRCLDWSPDCGVMEETYRRENRLRESGRPV